MCYRPWLGARTYERATKGLMGADAINEQKKEEEGRPEVRNLLWGLTLHTERLTFELPELKQEKAEFELQQPMYQWGNRKLARSEVSKLRGNGTYWRTACPAVTHFLRSVDRLLAGSREPVGVPRSPLVHRKEHHPVAANSDS